MDQPMGGRGPDQRALALRRNADAILAALQEEERLERVLGDLRSAEEWAASLGLHPALPSFGKVMGAAYQVHRGVAFWDREPVEPVPAAAP